MPSIPLKSSDLPGMEEFSGQAVRDQVIQRASLFTEAAPKIPPTAGGQCRQITKFTLSDSSNCRKKATVYKNINLALVEILLKFSEYVPFRDYQVGIRKIKVNT